VSVGTFSFAEELRKQEPGGRGRKDKDEAKRRRRRNKGALDPCRLNGTELKSFARRQARHVVVVVVLAWQSSRRRHTCLSFSLLSSACIIEIPERRRRREKERERERETRGKMRRSGGSGRKRKDFPRRIALLMELWLSVGPSYNVHYIYLPGYAVLPESRGSSPSST